MSDPFNYRFVDLVSANTGLHIRKQDWETVCNRIATRIKRLRLLGLEDYCRLLESGTDRGAREWRQLIPLLTTAETYFFRDRGQFALLRDRILPALIEQRRRCAGLGSSGLRLWSAGCSTGEEAYSLAILLKELLPNCDREAVTIWGTDINQAALDRAEQGLYGNWSFRHVDADLQRRYFQACRLGWQLNDEIREMVTFRYGNLVQDRLSDLSANLYDVDLILCRNVFVYFSTDAIATVLEKFRRSLRSDGYLMTGHTELHSHNLARWQTNVFKESLIYQPQPADLFTPAPTPKIPQPQQPPRTIDNPGPQQPTSPAKIPHPSLNPLTASLETTPSIQLPPVQNFEPASIDPSFETVRQLLRQAENQFRHKAYTAAIQTAEKILAQYPRHFDACCLLARAYANSAAYTKAMDYCKQALAVNPCAIAPHYLLAHIAEEQQDIEGAKIFLKRIIYLSPTSISAYLELGSLYESEGNITRARKMRVVAVELLRQIPAHTPIEPIALDRPNTVTAGSLLTQIEKLLEKR